MLLDSINVPAAAECRVDYEKQASDLKKKIDIEECFKDALIEFGQTDSMYELEKAEWTSLLTVLGTLCVVLPMRKKTCEDLLKKIEEQK